MDGVEFTIDQTILYKHLVIFVDHKSKYTFSSRPFSELYWWFFTELYGYSDQELCLCD